MTKKTTLSDEEMAQREAYSCLLQDTAGLCAFAAPSVQGRSNTVPPPDAEFLIANLELEFELNHRKQSPLEISNRKYFAICSAAFPSISTCVVPQTTNPNSTIHTIRISTNPRNITTYAFSNATKSTFSPFASAPAFLLAKARPAI